VIHILLLPTNLISRKLR